MKQIALTRQGEMKELIEKGGKLKTEMLELEAWLLKNVLHAEFIAKAHHRNWLTVEIDRVRKKLEIHTGTLTEKDYHDNVSIQPNRQQY